MNKLIDSKEKIEWIVSHHHQFYFPEFIKKLRTAIGITQTRMAEDLGLHKLKVFNLEHNGSVKVTPTLIFTLSDYFDIPVGILKEKVDMRLHKRRRDG